MSRIGLARRRVRFEMRVKGKNYAGVVNGDWTPLVGPVWGRLEPLRGGETVQAGLVQGKEYFRCTLRSTRATRAITTGCRIVDDKDTAATYNITAIMNPDERNKFLSLMCIREVAAG